MANPKTIREVFNTEHYIKFVSFCENRNLFYMTDLIRCPFDQLSEELGTSAVLRIKSMIALYAKTILRNSLVRKRQTMGPSAKV